MSFMGADRRGRAALVHTHFGSCSPPRILSLAHAGVHTNLARARRVRNYLLPSLGSGKYGFDQILIYSLPTAILPSCPPLASWQINDVI